MPQQKKTWIELTGGACGGVAMVLTTHPLDLAKTQMQANPSAYRGVMDCLKQNMAVEGPRGLYRGVLPPTLVAAPYQASAFAGYGIGQQLVSSVTGLDSTKGFGQMLAGGISGFFTTTVICPGERIKVVIQTSKEPLGLGGAMSRIFAEGGISSLFRGWEATLGREVPGGMVYWACYNTARQAIEHVESVPSSMKELFGGGMAGVGYWVFSLPADTIKSMQQASTTNLSMAGAAKQVMSESGPLGFWRGFTPAVLRAFPANGSTFLVATAVRNFLNARFNKDD